TFFHWLLGRSVQLLGSVSEKSIVCVTDAAAHPYSCSSFCASSRCRMDTVRYGQLFFRQSLVWAGSVTASSRKYPLVCLVLTRFCISIPFLQIRRSLLCICFPFVRGQLLDSFQSPTSHALRRQKSASDFQHPDGFSSSQHR